MLEYIKIKNLALIEELTLEFGSGFITVTGETGAGKSVLLGALSMLSGARTEKTVIGAYGDSAEVQAALNIEKADELNPFLDSLGLPACEDNILLLNRSISKKKMARISVNGVLTTLGNLQALGEFWIDFHGPGEPQKLFKNGVQLQLLDLYAKNADRLSEYQLFYKEWMDIIREIDHLKNATAISPDEMDFLRSQLDQIESFELSEEAVNELEDDYNRIEKAQDYQSGVDTMEAAFNASHGVISNLAKASKAALEIVEIDSSQKEIQDRIENLMVEAEDLSSEIKSLYSRIHVDEYSMQEIRQRMNLWMELRRRYGQTVELVKSKRDAMRKRIEDSSDVEEKLHRLEEMAASKKKILESLAVDLRQHRKKAALGLSKKVASVLLDLGFKKAQLKIEILPEKELKEWGDCYCEFMFSANAGHSLQPLRKIASSGETARVMLAFKSILAEFDETPVLVFDEVDANVGGEVGSSVGKLLNKLSSNHQVFCVTHLPQVASQGNEHYLVEKSQSDDTTGVSIRPIHTAEKERLTEIARMLGDRKSKTALSMAEELLKA